MPGQISDSFAETVAAYRAAESLRPEAQRVCDDPFARHFLNSWYRLLASNRWLANLGVRFADRVVPGAPGEVIARTVFFDDCLKKQIAEGIEQLVILGAGFDTRAFRFQHVLHGVKVFELDKPATQTAKVDRAGKLAHATPADIIYVPIDFDTDSIEDRLIAGGYDPTAKTLFIWEGVTMYLTAEAVDQTLAFVAARSGPGSSIVFNYIHEAVADGADVGDVAARWRIALARRGAPARFGIKKGQIETFLADRGLSVIERADVDLYKEYFARANRTRPIISFMPAVHARVGEE